jgi:hypothetical protein
LRAAFPHPFVRHSPRARRRALWALATLAGLCMLALAALDAELRTPEAPRGIVSFELAGTAARAQRILESWGAEGRARAVRSFALDFVFLAAYAPGLALLCAAASDRQRALGSPLADAGALLAWGQLAAGGFDALENLALLRTLGAGAPAGWPAFAAACAWAKFALVAAGLAYPLSVRLGDRLWARAAR